MLELYANILTAVCIILAGRNSIHTWWTGIIACVLFGALFYSVQLYADATLQVFFLCTGIIGWVNWHKNNNSAQITKTNPSTLFGYLVLALVVAAGYGLLLHKYTDAYAPWIDSTVLTFSVVAQLLLMRRKLETWKVWLLVNTLSVPLFWNRELYLTAVLYAGFWVNALISLRHWNKLYKAQQ